MKISNLIAYGLLVTLGFILLVLISAPFIVPHYGECYIDEQSHEHCTLFGIEVITVEEIQ